MSASPPAPPDPGRLAGVRVVLGVSGGIAAYKAVELARLLVGAGAEVDTVLTRGATHFVGRATFAGITGRPCRTDLFEEAHRAPHLELARQARVVVVLPATAHLLARVAHGLADDLLTTVLLAARCPVLLAPAMHTAMWDHPATQANVATLRDRGVHLAGPAAGELMGGDVGEGRAVEPEELLDRVVALVGPSGVLAGRTVVVTAGGTREPLDPVRFLSNRSSGKMGFAVAAEAARRGATVHLVAGPTHLATPPGVTRHDVLTARDMRDAVVRLAAGADAVVKAAAVSDFRPASPARQKIKKEEGALTLKLERNPDILAELGRGRSGSRPLLVGFAAETENVEDNGRRKLQEKGADLLVVNDVSGGNAGFEVDTNRAVILGRDGRRVEVALTSKREVAARLVEEMIGFLR